MMTNRFTGRRRAEEFATAFDGGSTGSDAHSAEVARLVGVVTALRAQPQPAPRPEFTGELRERLMTEAQLVLTADNDGLTLPVRVRGARERRLVAAASAVVFIGGTAGLAAAAQNALPGEALYPIKRGIERAEVGLSTSRAGKGQDLLDQANDRLEEVSGLLAQNWPQTQGTSEGTQQVAATLGDFSVQATEGADLLLGSFEDTRDPSSVVEVRTFAAENIKLLEGLAENVPPDAQDELAAAALTLREIDARATALCGSCATDLPDLRIPGLILARSEVERAMGLVPSVGLDNSHPVVVPKGSVDQKSDGNEAEDTPGPAPTGAPTDAPTGVPSPDELDPDDLPTSALPGTDPDVPAVPTAPSGAPDPDEDATSGLDDVVETLLPDTDVPNPLP